MAIEIVSFPMNSMVIFNSYVKLPEGNRDMMRWFVGCHRWIVSVFLMVILTGFHGGSMGIDGDVMVTEVVRVNIGSPVDPQMCHCQP